MHSKLWLIIRWLRFDAVALNPDSDNNICSAAQVAIAKAKNWDVKNTDGEPFGGTSIEEVIPTEQHNIKVWTQDGVLFLSGLEVGMPIQVYAAAGTMMHTTVASGATLEIRLPRGAAYVVRVGSYAVKAVMP